MTSIQQSYAELLALTKSYLQQEHSLTDRILSEPDTYAYFKAYALQRQNAKTQPRIPAQAAPTAVVPAPRIAPPAPTPVKAPVADLAKPPAPPVAPPPQNIEVPQSNKPDFNKATTAPHTPKQENTADQPAPTPGAFKLEVPAALPQADFSALRTIVNEKLPHVRLLDKLPDDTEAKKLANAWTQEKKIPQVMILSFDEPPKQQAFLVNIAKALEAHGIDAQVATATKLERENEWQKLLQSKELKLMVAGSSGFHSLPQLQKHYREGTKQGRHYLGDRLLLLLSDISYYLKEPALKPSLWAALKALLANNSAAL